MQGKYVVIAFIIIIIGSAPVAASTAKIAAGSPVYLGENNLDISSALNGCRTIAWWQEGANTSAPPQKNMTLYEMNTVPDTIFHYNISLDNFAGYSGPWYCIDREPQVAVFEVLEPQLDIKAWDLDHNEDVSGKSVPVSTHVTYRVETNLYQALLPLNRPNINPSDSFFTVVLTNPSGRAVSTIYTGNAGNPKTQILSFEKQPFITVSPYSWKNGENWDHTARGRTGETLYPLGTYTFSINQDLSSMGESYNQNRDLTGIIMNEASVTFIKDTSVVPSPTTQPVSTTVPAQTISTTPPLSHTGSTTVPTSPPLPVKTTYTPLPGWIGLASIIIAGLIVLGKGR